MRERVDCTTGISILVVEDEEQARGTVSRMLTQRFPGIKLYSAENGRIGLELYRRHLPELIITDIKMPQMNGIEFARTIHKVDPTVSIIVMSAHNLQDQLDLVEMAIAHFVPKPIDKDSLFAAVSCCLERST